MRSDDEKRILGLWPKYEDGGYVMPGDVAVANSGAKKGRAFTVISVRVNTVGVCLTDCDGSYWNYKAGDRRVKRPEPKVLDADGVEIKVGDTVWHEDGRELRVIGFDTMQDGETVLIAEYAAEPTKLGEVRCLSVSHTLQDSWERLKDDATMSAWSYRDKYGIAVGVSDGKYIPTTVAFALDLVRRAKALSEGGGMR